MELLFSLTKKDFEIETFCTGGKGGQNQNRKEKGIRIRHLESGAVGEGREFREQIRNKEAAFRRLVESKKFQQWHKIEVARRLGQKRFETPEEILDRVDTMIYNGLRDGTIQVEYIGNEV